jgi:hypothetical protein
MINPLEKCIQEALKSNDELLRLFNRMGSSEYQNGEILIAYRNAKRAVQIALAEDNKLDGLKDITGQLKRSVQSSVRSTLKDAQAMGADNAARQLRHYGIKSLPYVLGEFAGQLDGGLDIVVSKVETQILTCEAILRSEVDDTLIVGDDTRQGILRPGDVLGAAAFWAAALAWDAWSQIVQKNSEDSFGKQAIAAIDNKTTDCCLRVHGQIQPLNKPFHLTGTPCFAEYLDGPPFHWHCRTSVALYLGEFDDGITDRLKSSAETVLDERSRGVWKERRPADAYS